MTTSLFMFYIFAFVATAAAVMGRNFVSYNSGGMPHRRGYGSVIT